MARSPWQHVQVGLLTVASLTGGQAMPAQAGVRTSPPAAASVPQDSDAAMRNAHLRLRISDGDRSMLDILTKPEFESARKGLAPGPEYPTFSLTEHVKTSPVTAQTLASIKVKDCIDGKGNYKFDMLLDRLNEETTRAIGRMAGEHKTVAQAMREDSAVAFAVSASLFELPTDKSGHPALQDFARTTKLSALFTSKGKPKEKQISEAIAKALYNVPLVDLQKPELRGAHYALRRSISSSDKDLASYETTLMEPNNPYLRLPGAQQLTIGDILGPSGLTLDPQKMVSLLLDQDVKARQYTLDFALQAAKTGVSTYDFVTHPDDPAQVAPFYLKEAPGILGLLADGRNKVPREMQESLKRLPLSAAINKDGVFDPDKIRDAAIEPVKNWTLLLLSQYPDTALALLGPEAGAAVVQQGASGPWGEHRIETIGAVRLGQFISGGDPKAFEAARAAFVESAYPAEARALDTIIAREPGNAWPQFKTADGWTEIPYSFNITKNQRLNELGMDEMTRPVALDTPPAAGNKPATPEGTYEKDLVRYALGQAENAGINVRFREVDALSVIDGKPQGILLYKAGMEHVPLNTSSGEHAGGMAFGSMHVQDGKLMPNTRVDIVMDNIEAKWVEQWAHEVLGHSLGLCHPQNPCPGDRTLPGTVDADGVHSVPGIMKDTTLMSYQWKKEGITQIEPLTLGSADIEALGRIYGTHPVDEGKTLTYRPRMGTLADVIKSNDPQAIWIGKENPFSQTFAGGSVKTLDMSELDGQPLTVRGDIDLSRPANIIHLADRSGFMLPPVEVVGHFRNAVIGNGGTIIGAPGEGVLEAKMSGTLNANGGSKTLKGGSGMTFFISGGGKTRVEIHPDMTTRASEDTFIDYVPGQDTVVAPAGTIKARVTLIDKLSPMKPDVMAMLPRPGAYLAFEAPDGQILKSLRLFSGNEKALGLKNIAIESVSGKRLPLELTVAHAFEATDPTPSWIQKLNKTPGHSGFSDKPDILPAQDKAAQSPPGRER
jgi:hypothetical protein